MAPERDGQGQLFASHLEEQQIRQLLDIVAVAHPACLCVARRQVVAEDVAVVPEFLNDGRGCHSSAFPLLLGRYSLFVRMNL